MLKRVNLLVGGGLHVASEGAAVGGRQVGGARVERLLRVDCGSLLLLGLLRLLLLIGRACGRGRVVTLGEVIHPRLSGLLAI